MTDRHTRWKVSVISSLYIVFEHVKSTISSTITKFGFEGVDIANMV